MARSSVEIIKGFRKTPQQYYSTLCTVLQGQFAAKNPLICAEKISKMINHETIRKDKVKFLTKALLCRLQESEMVGVVPLPTWKTPCKSRICTALRLSKNEKIKGFGGKDSVKENRQGCLSRSIKNVFRTFSKF